LEGDAGALVKALSLNLGCSLYGSREFFLELLSLRIECWVLSCISRLAPVAELLEALMRDF
jgi:hypothetical protein